MCDRSVLDLGQFEGCPPVRGRPWRRGGATGGLRVGRGRASSLPAEIFREVASLEAASLESIVASKVEEGKKQFLFLLLFLAGQSPSIDPSNITGGF